MGHIFAGWGIELYTKMSRIHEEKHLVSGLLFFLCVTDWPGKYRSRRREDQLVKIIIVV